MEVDKKIAKKSGQNGLELEVLFWWLMIPGLVGARIYHVAHLWSSYYSFAPIKALYIWNGGLGIWGGLVGGVLGLVLFYVVNKPKIGLVKLFDITVVGLPLAQAVGRIGNWINNEMWGKPSSWLGIRHPLFLYEAVLNLILFGVLLITTNKKKVDGQPLAIYLLGYGLIRLILENLRTEETIWSIGNVDVARFLSVVCITSAGVIYWIQRRSD